MPSRHLLVNDCLRKERLSISTFTISTGLKNLRAEIANTIAISLYSLEFGFVTFFTKHELYKTCSFQSGSENYGKLINIVFPIRPLHNFTPCLHYNRGRRGRMLVGFITTYAISAYQH